MTIDEFIEEFRKVAPEFDIIINIKNQIRASFDCHCPITMVCLKKTGKLYLTRKYDDAAVELGLSFLDSDMIAAAADNKNTVYYHDNTIKRTVPPEIRTRLLEAIGIQPTII